MKLRKKKMSEKLDLGEEKKRQKKWLVAVDKETILGPYGAGQ